MKTFRVDFVFANPDILQLVFMTEYFEAETISELAEAICEYREEVEETTNLIFIRKHVTEIRRVQLEDKRGNLNLFI